MNSLTVDEKTGFLQNNFTSDYGFTVDKKVLFLELASQYRKDGKFPKVSAICDLIGINIRSFERHLELDTKFATEWKEISTHVEYDCISDMSALRTKNPMYMFGLLRYLNPKRWNPNEKAESTLNINVFSDAVREVQAFKDAEIVSSSPAIALQAGSLPSSAHIPTKDLPTEEGSK